MKRRILSVLRSRTGASITFALLLFLACAVVGALVLTAGSAAAGRVSNLAQSDQRYYNVTSAAGLLAGELSGKTVSIERTREITTTTVTKYNVNLAGSGSVVGTDGAPTKTYSAYYATKINGDDGNMMTVTVPSYNDPTADPNEGTSISLSNMSFLNSVAVQLLFYDSFNSSLVCNTDEAMNGSMKKGTEQSGLLQLVHTASTDDSDYGLADPDSLTVDCNYLIQSDGTIILTLKNSTDKDGETYTLCVRLSPDIVETESETTETLSTTRDNYTENGFTETVITRTTLTKTSEISWTISGVEKVVSEADISSQPISTDAPGGD